MKFLGSVCIAVASIVLTTTGFNIFTWQWWVVTLGYLTGEFLICESYVSKVVKQ